MARLWDVQSGQLLKQFTAGNDAIYGVAISPNGQYLATGSLDKTAGLFDIRTGAEIRRFSGHTDQIYSVTFSPDGQFIVIPLERGRSR